MVTTPSTVLASAGVGFLVAVGGGMNKNSPVYWKTVFLHYFGEDRDSRALVVVPDSGETMPLVPTAVENMTEVHMFMAVVAAVMAAGGAFYYLYYKNVKYMGKLPPSKGGRFPRSYSEFLLCAVNDTAFAILSVGSWLILYAMFYTTAFVFNGNHSFHHGYDFLENEVLKHQAIYKSQMTAMNAMTQFALMTALVQLLFSLVCRGMFYTSLSIQFIIYPFLHLLQKVTLIAIVPRALETIVTYINLAVQRVYLQLCFGIIGNCAYTILTVAHTLLGAGWFAWVGKYFTGYWCGCAALEPVALQYIFPANVALVNIVANNKLLAGIMSRILSQAFGVHF